MGIILDGSVLHLSGTLGPADHPYLKLVLKTVIIRGDPHLTVATSHLDVAEASVMQALCAAWILMRLSGDDLELLNPSPAIQQQFARNAMTICRQRSGLEACLNLGVVAAP